MPVFAYRALAPGGGAEAGVVDAASARGAWQELRARGLYPTEVHEDGGTDRAHVRTEALAAATRQLATLVGAGVPVAEALEAVANETEEPPLRRALTVARAHVREGEPLAEAFAASPRVFPPLHSALVRAGEASGALPAVLARLAGHAETEAARRARLRAALTYPLVVLGTAGVVLVFLLAWVMPQVTRLFADSGTPLPLATRALLGGVAFARTTAWAWLLAAAAAVLVVRRLTATPQGRSRLDAARLRLPIAGPLVHRAAIARVTRTLAALVSSGIPLEPALGLAAGAAGNARIAEATLSARESVRQGQPLATALRAARVFPALLVRLAATGERGGALAAALERAAVSQETDLDAAVSRALMLLEPLLILVMGAVVLGLVLAVLVPILTLDPLAHR